MAHGDEDDRRHANTMIATGVGVAALGVLSAAIGAAVCPVCVVAAPALIGVGALERARAARRARLQREAATDDDANVKAT